MKYLIRGKLTKLLGFCQFKLVSTKNQISEPNIPKTQNYKWRLEVEKGSLWGSFPVAHFSIGHLTWYHQEYSRKDIWSICYRYCLTEHNNIIFFVGNYLRTYLRTYLWNSLLEWDEQSDRPNSQTSMEWCHMIMLNYFLGFFKNTTAYHLDRYSLHLLLLNSSKTYLDNVAVRILSIRPTVAALMINAFSESLMRCWL